MLILYLGVLISGLYYVTKILGPEMAKAPSDTTAITKIVAPKIVTPRVITPKIIKNPEPVAIPDASSPDRGIEKLEILLAEKNRNMGILQKELSVFHVQVRDFDKIKTLMEDEIHRLREQNRIFRSELGLPAVAPSQETILGLENSRT